MLRSCSSFQFLGISSTDNIQDTKFFLSVQVTCGNTLIISHFSKCTVAWLIFRSQHSIFKICLSYPQPILYLVYFCALSITYCFSSHSYLYTNSFSLTGAAVPPVFFLASSCKAICKQEYLSTSIFLQIISMRLLYESWPFPLFIIYAYFNSS